MSPVDAPQDAFRYSPEDVAAFAEEFTIEPVPAGTVRDRLADGQVPATADIPDYLDRAIASDASTAIALYRLVQLFGTPNVPVLEAGADQPEREKRTWQYLFRVDHNPEEGEGRECLLSVYDYRTNLSVGVAEWQPGETVPEPSGDPLPSGEMPDEAFLERLVQLVLSTVEHAVEATYQDLYV